MTDAMGHSIGAAVLATVLVGALRNARRAGAGLGEQARLANAGLGEHAGWAPFVTGQLARIHLRNQTASIVNAGHPSPIRLRHGRLEHVALEADPPFGIVPGGEYREQPLPLEPGDRLIFLTDGMTERGAAAVDIERLIEASAGMHPRQAVQHLVHEVLEATGGTPEDDATVMCLDWHGGPPRKRHTDSGADKAVARRPA